jgi:hypothetical protein
MNKHLSNLARLLSGLLLILPLLWSFGLWYYQPISLLPTAVILGAILIWRRRRKNISVHLILWLLVLTNAITYQCIPGPTPENWQTPWAKAPQFEQNGDSLTIHNIRDFRYRTEEDSDVRYRSETYDLNTLCGVDFASCHWDGMTAVCHTMLSFHFADGRRVVVSAETRLPEGEAQGALPGLYKRYGILYMFGTEEDIFGLRTNIRHEDLYIFPLKIKQKGARKLLLHYVELARHAEATHQDYNTISDNCSTGIVSGFRELVPTMARKYDFLPLHNGSIADLLISYGAVQTRPGETPEQIRTRCYAGYDLPMNDYSAALRRKISK